MTTARVFQSGNSQAVRLPKEFRFTVKDVEIFQRGDEIILRERRYAPADALAIFTGFPTDFMEEGRKDSAPQTREGL